jgi:uncharacterized protein YggE
MVRRIVVLVPALIIGVLQLATAQDVQVSRANKTVEVTVTTSVDADHGVVIIGVGYRNYGSSKGSAFAENVHAANRIIQAFLDAKVSKESIETQTVRLERMEPEEKWTPQTRSERQFEADQSWIIRVPVVQGQGIVDMAVKVSANHIRDVDWEVRDTSALEIKAGMAALTG